MLLCMLSQILITKKKNADILLNAPDISKIYQTVSFKNKVLLTTINNNNPIIVLNGIDIEELLANLWNNSILDTEDIFIPLFETSKYTNGYLYCGGKITNSTNRFGIVT